MLARGVTTGDIARAVAVANRDYAGNLEVRTGPDSIARGVRFTLGVSDSHLGGAHLSASYFRLQDGSRRRTRSACWHAHRDVLRALFELVPNAIVITALARYNGAGGFESTFPATAGIQAGPPIDPVAISALCDCGRKPRARIA